ncbi:MAG: hypothetical protein IPI67_26130 [Myxococcales bacterium]|nr:hypothetical protein [Myxococcales bacterium]
MHTLRFAALSSCLILVPALVACGSDDSSGGSGGKAGSGGSGATGGSGGTGSGGSAGSSSGGNAGSSSGGGAGSGGTTAGGGAGGSTGGMAGMAATGGTSSDGGGCTPTTTPGAQVVDCAGATIAKTIDIAGFAFAPATLSVSVGDVVKFDNKDASGHTATSGVPGCADGNWDTGSIGGSTSKCVKLTAAGSYPFFCAIHPSMTGTITAN